MKSLHFSSLRGKLIILVLLTIAVFIAVDVTLFAFVNHQNDKLEGVYATNISLNELNQALEDLRGTSYEYLNSGSPQSLLDYQEKSRTMQQMAQAISNEISDQPARILEKNMRGLIESYLEQLSLAVSYRGELDVARYTERYVESKVIYADLLALIRALDTLRFETNSQNFSLAVQSIGSLETWTLIVLVLVAVSIVSILYWITGGITKPLVSLAQKAEEIGRGYFDITMEEPVGYDEISVVTRGFNRMVTGIQEQMQSTRKSLEIQLAMKETELETNKLLKEAQLKFYQAQIDPHFLFNTLNAGQQLAMMEGAERTYDFLDNLAAFCRYRVSKTGEESTIREELGLVKNYMHIMNVRYGGDIVLNESIDSRLLDTRFPGMVLQPIVENAVRYGLSEKETDKQIWLEIKREKERMRISIRDNGVGMGPELIARFRSGEMVTSAEAGTGVGLGNVQARLRLFYERTDVFEIYSEGKDKGVEVVIRVPYERKEPKRV